MGLIAAVVLAVWAAPALARSTWLYVEFDGSGTGVAQNATGNGGTAQLNASWTLLYKLPVQVLGSTFSVACQGSSCLYPYAASGSGTASLTGSSAAAENCSGKVSMDTSYYGTAYELRYVTGPRWLTVSSYSPLEAGLNLGYSSGMCIVTGGDSAEGSGTAVSRRYTFSELIGHPGVVYSTRVHGSSSRPGVGAVLTPQNVRWSGYVKLKLGGCKPTLSNLKRCFPLPRRR